MLPCYFKHFTGFDCPGCGFQRSVIALIQGDFIKSFHLYPGAVFILILLLISLSEVFYSSSNLKQLRNIFLCMSVAVVVISYLSKLIA